MDIKAIWRWKKYGVELERSNTSGDVPVYCISVPSSSDFIDDKGNELSGMLLAKRVKRDLGSDVQLRCRIRQEHWTHTSKSQSQRSKINTDTFVNAFQKAEERQKKENLRAFLDGLFGGGK